MSAHTSDHSTPRRPLRLTLLGFNLVALAALAVPAALMLWSMGADLLAPSMLLTIAGLFAAGIAACGVSMLLLNGPGGHKQTVVLLLPVALFSLSGAFALLVGMTL